MELMAIKILHIIKSLGRGGAEMLLPETLKLHNKNDFEFHYIYFLPWKDQMVESIQQNGGIVTCISAGNNLSLMMRIWKVRDYIRKNDIQLVHAHLPWAGILARIVGRLTGIPVIYTEHNKQERYHTATRIMNLSTLNLASRVIAVSEDVRSSIISNKRGLTVPVSTVLNGVNTDHFNRSVKTVGDIRQKLNIPPHAPIVGTIAVFRVQKRLDLWMDIAQKISERVPGVHFVIVGDGPLKEDLLKKRNDIGMNDRIHMPGLETEIRPYLFSFDVFMMSSIFEGLPIALLEAMSMGCPVIATRAGGIGEVIRHEEDGLLCEINDPDKLVDYAVALLSSKEMTQQYGERSRKRILEHFSMNAMVKELETLYRNSL
jgi:glycosyltransferase involved in cell wall biosynthesis